MSFSTDFKCASPTKWLIITQQAQRAVEKTHYTSARAASFPQTFATPLLQVPGLVANKPHLVALRPATTSSPAAHFKLARQTQLGQQQVVCTHGVRARQPWRTGHYLPGWWGNLAQARRGRCVSSQYLRAATSGVRCVVQPRLSRWSTRAAAQRHKTVSEPLGGFGHVPWHLPGAPAPSRHLQGESSVVVT